MYYIIRTLADEIKLGAAFEAGKSYSNVIENYDVVFRTVAGKWYSDYLGQAIWFYQNPEFPVIQCFWPDKNN